MNTKNYFLGIIAIILLTDLTILLNIPFLRQILGFLFLTILPGLLILQILKLNKIGLTEKIILTVGLSVSFLMFFGLLINSLSLGLEYETPLATIPLLISFNVAFIALAIVGYIISKDMIFSLSDLNLTTSEKAFLIIPILFPALSIFGMHVMNTSDNNILLISLLFLIPTYVISVCFFNQKFTKRLYPIVIYLISISLLLLMSLRSDHIIGVDTHLEYYFFMTTLHNVHWSVFGHSTLDACLSISLLPTIYQSLLNIPTEVLFKVLYSLIYSISPLIIYILSKRYIGELYGFLASCFFMFQSIFLMTTANSRTCTAVLFFTLAMMTLFNDKIEPLKKKILFITFMVSCIVSHYSTTYIFFFIMIGSFLGIKILSKKYTFEKVVSLTIIFLFFVLIFVWYSQVTKTAFNAGIGFIETTLSELNQFFIEESREGSISAMFGEKLTQKGIPHGIEFVLTWLTFAFMGIGVLTLIRGYHDMSFPELNLKKLDFLKDKFEVEYLVITLVCSGLLVAMVVLPFISKGYDIQRVYAVAITILSVFFVIGGIMLSRHLKVRAYFVILVVLTLYFLSVTGVTYQIFGYPRSIILNSGGEQHSLFVYDQDSYGAKWAGNYAMERLRTDIDLRIYTDFIGGDALTSQGKIPLTSTDRWSLIENKTLEGYIYLRHYNLVNDELDIRKGGRRTYNLSDYTWRFIGKNKIYVNGGSEVYL